MNIAFFGSAFNPPHLGHYDVVLQALNSGFDHVIVSPAMGHPFGKVMLPFDMRVDMTELMFADLINKGQVTLTTIEQDLFEIANGAVYTYDVLSVIKTFCDSPFGLNFIVGPDNYKQGTWQKFYNYDKIEQEFGIFVAQERVMGRSSDIRKMFILDNQNYNEMMHTDVNKYMHDNREIIYNFLNKGIKYE